MEAMNFRSVGDDETLETLIADDEWVMEQKMDGTRGLAVLTYGEQPQMLARRGPLKHTAATQHLPGIWEGLSPLIERRNEIVLDGEIMIHTGEYRVFDLLQFVVNGREVVTSGSPFQFRREALEWLMKMIDSPRVSIVYQARGEQSKRDLLDGCRAFGVEGVMLKALHAPYSPGQRTEAGLKYKFVKTADVVVTEVSRRRNDEGREVGSIEFGVAAPPEWEMSPRQQQKVRIAAEIGVLPIGRCSVIGKPHVAPGDVIEVAYLYWTGSTTYQPRMVRVRHDKAARECGMDQFRDYSREAIS